MPDTVGTDRSLSTCSLPPSSCPPAPGGPPHQLLSARHGAARGASPLPGTSPWPSPCPLPCLFLPTLPMCSRLIPSAAALLSHAGPHPVHTGSRRVMAPEVSACVCGPPRRPGKLSGLGHDAAGPFTCPLAAPAPGAEIPRSSELGPEQGWQHPIPSLQDQEPRTSLPCCPAVLALVLSVRSPVAVSSRPPQAAGGEGTPGQPQRKLRSGWPCVLLGPGLSHRRRGEPGAVSSLPEAAVPCPAPHAQSPLHSAYAISHGPAASSSRMQPLVVQQPLSPRGTQGQPWKLGPERATDTSPQVPSGLCFTEFETSLIMTSH